MYPQQRLLAFLHAPALLFATSSAMHGARAGCDGQLPLVKHLFRTGQSALTSGATDSPPSPILDRKRPSPDGCLAGTEAPRAGVAACSGVCLSRPGAAPPLLAGGAAAAALGAAFAGVAWGVASAMTSGSCSCAPAVESLSKSQEKNRRYSRHQQGPKPDIMVANTVWAPHVSRQCPPYSRC